MDIYNHNFNNTAFQLREYEKVIDGAYNNLFTITTDPNKSIVRVTTVECEDVYVWEYEDSKGKKNVVRLSSSKLKQLPVYDSYGYETCKNCWYRICKDGYLRPIISGTLTTEKSFSVNAYEVSQSGISRSTIRNNIKDGKVAASYIL